MIGMNGTPQALTTIKLATAIHTRIPASLGRTLLSDLPGHQSEVEQLFKEPAAFFLAAIAVIATRFIWHRVSRRGGCRGEIGTSINDLVKFAPVEPNATAFRTIIDFDTGAFGNHKLGLVDRTFHGCHLLIGSDNLGIPSAFSYPFGPVLSGMLARTTGHAI
jgi:hypothetical protein